MPTGCVKLLLVRGRHERVEEGRTAQKNQQRRSEGSVFALHSNATHLHTGFLWTHNQRVTELRAERQCAVLCGRQIKAKIEAHKRALALVNVLCFGVIFDN